MHKSCLFSLQCLHVVVTKSQKTLCLLYQWVMTCDRENWRRWGWGRWKRGKASGVDCTLSFPRKPGTILSFFLFPFFFSMTCILFKFGFLHVLQTQAHVKAAMVLEFHGLVDKLIAFIHLAYHNSMIL